VRKNKEKINSEPTAMEQICIDIKDYTCLFIDAKKIMVERKETERAEDIDFNDIFSSANEKKYKIFELVKALTPEETIIIQDILQESSKELK
jgi:hypothetical protein